VALAARVPDPAAFSRFACTRGVALAARVPDPFFATAFFATAFFGPFFAASGLTAARFSRFAWL
jgi:hypothetical protein